MKLLRNAALGSALAVLGVAQAASIVVDDFNDPAAGQLGNLNNPPGAGTYVASTPGGGILGGQRDLTYNVTYTAPTTASVEVNTLTSPSRLTESAGDFATPDLVLSYSANGAGLHANLSATSLTLHDLHTDLAQTVRVWLFTTGGDFYSASVPVAGGFAGNLTVSAFAATGAPNIHNINTIEVEFAGMPGADFSLHSITVVPEPATYGALTALGLLGMALWRRARV